MSNEAKPTKVEIGQRWGYGRGFCKTVLDGPNERGWFLVRYTNHAHETISEQWVVDSCLTCCEYLGTSEPAPPVQIPREEWPEPAVGQAWRAPGTEVFQPYNGGRPFTLTGLSDMDGFLDDAEEKSEEDEAADWGRSAFENGTLVYVGPGTWKPTEAAKPKRNVTAEFCVKCGGKEHGGRPCMPTHLAPMSEADILTAMVAQDAKRVAPQLFPAVVEKPCRQSVNLTSGGVWSLRP